MQDVDNNQKGFDILIQRAIEASHQNDSVTALRLLKEASLQHPQSGLPHFLTAAEYAQLGKMAEAEVAFADAVLLAPNLHIARFQLGLLQFSSGRPAIGLVTWQPLLQLPNEDPLRWFVQGFAELAQDHFDQALSFFEQGMALNQNNAPLNGDIDLIIKEIRKVQTKNAEQAEHRLTGSEGTSNFLLNIYQQHNKIH